jgi:glycosyltransferase involved in cell wall biosynthesis
VGDMNLLEESAAVVFPPFREPATVSASGDRVKVLLVSRSPVHHGGVVNYIQLLVKNADPRSIFFEQVFIGRETPSSPTWKRPWEYVRSVKRFVTALRRGNPDIIHLNPSLNWQSLPLNLLLLLIAKVFSRSIILIFSRGWRDEVAISMIESTCSGSFLRSILKLADFYVVLTKGFRQQLIAAGLPAERISVSPVMVEAGQFQTDRRVVPQGVTPDGKFRILFLSRLSRNKGVWHLAKSIKWMRANHAQARIVFILAGTGPDADSLQSFLKAEIEAGIVSMPGYVRGLEKQRLYREADLFVFPSYHEGFPNVVVEALAAGLPLIYTPVGALKDVLGP